MLQESYIRFYLWIFRTILVRALAIGIAVNAVVYLGLRLISGASPSDRVLIAILAFTLVGGVSQAVLLSLGHHTRMRDLREVRAYLGEDFETINPRLFRSRDGTRQFRTTRSDLPKVKTYYAHFERLSSDGRLITESSSVRVQPREPGVDDLMGLGATLGKRTRLFALVSPGANATQRVAHLNGKPPTITGGSDRRRLLPVPRVLVIVERPDGVFLFRFTAEGRYAGDTWHRSVALAKDQAAHEYGTAPAQWSDIPAHVTDVVRFATASLTNEGISG